MSCMKFGWHIRAARIGYHPLPDAEGLLRIRLAGQATALCELRPYELVPLDKGKFEYVCWWDKDYALLKASPFLSNISKVLEPCSILLDQNGQPIEPVAAHRVEMKGESND